MRSIGKHISVNDSPELRRAAGNLLEDFTAEVDTVSDLLLLLDECACIIDKDSRQRLVDKIWQIIDEDLAEGEYDEDEAGIYRRRLNNCVLRSSEPGGCKSVDLECVGVSSVIRYLKSLSCSVLSWELISTLLERAGSNVILIMKLVRDVLSDPTLFNLHPLIIGAVIRRDDVLQVCDQLIPDFALLLDCHYNSIMLAQSCPERIPYINVISPLRCDKLVEMFRARNLGVLEVELFTPAFLLRMDGWHEKFFVSSFWKQLLIEPHTLLTNFWRAARMSIRRNCYLQLLRNIRAIIGSGLLRTVSPCMARGFLLTLYSIISTILHFVAESKAVMVEGIIQLVNQLDCFSTNELLFLRCSLDDVKFTECAVAEEIFSSIAEEFFCKGEVNDVRVFHCAEFWRCVRKSMKAKINHPIDQSTRDDVLSSLLLIWDSLPYIRPHIAPIFSYFGGFNTLPSRKLECHYAIRTMRDYCQLVLCDYRLESTDVFLSCLHILSCEAFQDQAILRPSLAKLDSHETNDLVSQWLISLYRDLVPETDENSTNFSDTSINETVIDDCVPVCAVDNTINVFRVISRHACCVPKLCQLVVPYVLAMDVSSTETAIELVLQYANMVVSSDFGSKLGTAQSRMARCLAECVDGIGLRRLSRVKLDYQFYFDGMCGLIKCCLLSDLPSYAFAVANILYDAIMTRQGGRHLAAFDGIKVNNAQFVELLKEIYVRIGSISGLETLPTELQNDDKVRVLFSRNRLDWLDVISNPEASLQDLVDAYSYCGINYSGDRRDLKYALAIRADKWSTISYPKRLISHEERLFAFLYSAGRDSLLSNEMSAFLEGMECEAAARYELPNAINIGHLRDFCVVGLGDRFVVEDLKALPINSLFIFVIYLSRVNGLEVVADMYRYNLKVAISELSERFIGLKAFTPCFALLKNCTGDWATIEKCRVLIAKGEYNTAEHHLRVLLQSTANYGAETEIEARCLLAELLADHKNMLDEAIILLQKGIERIEKSAIQCELRLRMFLLLHQLAARQLSGVEEHMESRAFRMREDAIREWTRQRSIASQGPPTHAARRIECELKCEREAVEAIKQKLVATAVDTVSAGLEALKLLSEPYIKQPHQSKHRNDGILRHIFPLIDVIFRFDNEKEVVKTFRMYVASGMVPAIWVNVVSHLMGHCFTKSILAPVIRTMIVKIIIAYPYHVLHTVLMYKFNENHAPIVETILEEAERRVADRSARMRLHEIIEDMTAAHIAYMQFVAAKVGDARFFTKRQVPGSSAVQYEMLDKLSLVRLTEVLQRVPLPVVEQKLCMPGDYSGDDLVKWGPMERICIQADGLSAPKVLRTKGSDGRLYKLIWKNEDVRQDCLVEQLFSIVNSILNGDEDSAFLRTYKVVPLDSKCGIIEFCQGTTSLKQLLCGLDLLGGLHAEEEPHDEKAIRMRNMLKDVAKSQGNQGSVIFRDACAKFQPVFRHFFYRNYATVREWTTMINNYRKSLAQWSIVTYVVGLGDRHLSNVLFETDTCKLVHIDLGMILEYSKRTLPIPERVPFRLTRDLLDPLLVEGTGGRLEEEAVHALQLLRESKHVIIGLASVLLRETISNFEEVDPGGGDRPSFVSETAIARLRDKLNGTDDTFGQQDVHHQVRRLFAEATNVDNISRMFIGWMGFV